MRTRADKTQETQSRAVANQISRKKDGSHATFQFVDNRPEAKQLARFQEMADNSPYLVAQRMLMEGKSGGPAQRQEESPKEAELQMKAGPGLLQRQGMKVQNHDSMQAKQGEVAQQEQGGAQPPISVGGMPVSNHPDIALEAGNVTQLTTAGVEIEAKDTVRQHVSDTIAPIQLEGFLSRLFGRGGGGFSELPEDTEASVDVVASAMEIANRINFAYIQHKNYKKYAGAIGGQPYRIYKLVSRSVEMILSIAAYVEPTQSVRAVKQIVAAVTTIIELAIELEAFRDEDLRIETQPLLDHGITIDDIRAMFTESKDIATTLKDAGEAAIG